MVKTAWALAALLGVATGVQQAAAVEVATEEEFLAALKADAKLIEVTDHLILNTGDALDVVNEGDSNGSAADIPGFLIKANGARLTIKVRPLCAASPATPASAAVDSQRALAFAASAHLLRMLARSGLTRRLRAGICQRVNCDMLCLRGSYRISCLQERAHALSTHDAGAAITLQSGSAALEIGQT